MFNADDLDDFDFDFEDEAPFSKKNAVPTDRNESVSHNPASKNSNSSQLFLRTKEPQNDVNKDRFRLSGDDDKHNSESRTVISTSSEKVAIANGSGTSNPGKRKSEGSFLELNLKNNKVTQQRLFPGPAGLLPDKPIKDLKNTSLIIDAESEALEGKNESVIIYSQSSASVFEEPPYLKLLSDFDMEKADSPLHKYTIDWVKKKVVNKAFIGKKIPFLAVVLQHLDHSTPDPVVTLRDPTGEIHGTLHRDAWNDMGAKFHPGAALALRQVGVLSVSRRQVYLNITMNNILSIYSSFEDSEEVEKNCINEMSSFDLLKTVDEWQAQAQAQSSTETPERNNTSHNSLFYCINNQDSPNLLKRKFNQSTPMKKPATVTNKSDASVKTAPQKCDFNISMDNINFDEFSKVKTPEKDQNKNATGVKFKPCDKKSILVTNKSEAPSKTAPPKCDFDISMDDIDFDEFSEEDILKRNQNKNATGVNFTQCEEISVENNRNKNTAGTKFLPHVKRPNFMEANKKPNESVTKPKPKTIFSQALTQEESQMVEEVLDGIDFDEF